MKLLRRYLNCSIILAMLGSLILMKTRLGYRLSFGSISCNKCKHKFHTRNISRTKGREKGNAHHHWSRGSSGYVANHLIDDYGENDSRLRGENGSKVILNWREQKKSERRLNYYNINVFVSDIVPLNRMIPDSRHPECANQNFDERNMPSVAVIIAVHNEWPSVLLRTIYSIINRTPPHLLKEIIIVDDCSNLRFYKKSLDVYVKKHFDRYLVKVFHLKFRNGLMKARWRAFNYVTAEVACIFDSHMEVNVDWLQPLLVEIMKNPKTIAMAQLDTINRNTLEYSFKNAYIHRYGFNWDLNVFETYPRLNKKLNKKVTESIPTPVTVGSGFAVTVNFFKSIGLYDTKMKIWGADNLELSWRAWCCGGRVVSVFCSRIGHISRNPPYKFKMGKMETLYYNLKRATEVWIKPYQTYIYNYFPHLKMLRVGPIEPQLAVKEDLQCKNFDWYLDNVWPELFRYDVNVTHTGMLINGATGECLDNNNNISPLRKIFYVSSCYDIMLTQAFSLTKQQWFRTSLHCVSVDCVDDQCFAVLKDCFDGVDDRWEYLGGLMKHIRTGFCLELVPSKAIMLNPCTTAAPSQNWTFAPFPAEV